MCGGERKTTHLTIPGERVDKSLHSKKNAGEIAYTGEYHCIAGRRA